MLKQLLTAGLLSAGMILAAQDAAAAAAPAGKKSAYTYAPVFRTAPIDPAIYADPAKAEQLAKKRGETVLKLHEAKRRIIAGDPQARKTQQEILKLMDQLTAIVERNESVKRINKDLKKIDEELDALPLKSAQTEVKTEPQPAADTKK